MTDILSPLKKTKLTNGTFFQNNFAFPPPVSKKVIEYPKTTKMGKLQFKLEQQIDAKNIFACDFIVRTLDNIFNEYYYDIMMSMFEKDDSNISSNTDDDVQPLKKTRYDSNQSGGELNKDCTDNILWCLNYGIADSLHDFGKDRNGIFPQFAKTKSRASDFLQIAEEILTKNYNEKAQGAIISSYDKLYTYYSSSPGNFEDVIKDNFLLGNICGDVDNMYYYFSENMPSSWGIVKTKYFEMNPPNQMNPFFEKLKTDGYLYFILDACMSIQTEPAWQNIMIMLKSLCNLWDPAGAGSLYAKDIVDGQTSMGLKLVLESTVNINNKPVYIYDSKTTSTDESMYDYVYDDLFNQHSIPSFKFKLRLASEKQHDTSSSTGLSTSPDINFYTSLSIQYKTEPVTYIIIPSGGFSVKILSCGLYYIETGDDYEIPTKQVNEYRILKQIIDYMQLKLTNSGMPPLTRKNYLYNIILRFKSTGDHGSARTTKFFNDILKQKTLYLSGDRLAYVYSIADNIPTVSRYYAGSSSNEMETDEEDTDESCDRVHFLGVLLPEYDPVITAKNKLDEILAYLESFTAYTPDNTETSLDVINKNLLQFNDKLKEQISNMDVNTLDTIGISSSIAVSNGILLPQLKKMRDTMNNDEFTSSSIEKIKEILVTLREYHDNVFYIKNYADIQSKIKKTIESQIKELNKIIEINAREITDISKPVEAINVRSSRNNMSFRPITWIKNLLTTNKQITTSAEFIELLKNTQDSESKTFYDKIRKTKDNFLSKITDLTLYMKEKYGNSAPFIVDQSKIIMRVYNDKITSKLKQDTSPVGKTIMNIFGFASEPVLAVPIEDDDIMNIIELNDKKVSKSTKTKIKDKITRGMKSVISAFSGRESALSKKRKLVGGSRKKRNKITHRKIYAVKNKQTRKQHNKIMRRKTIKNK